MMRPMTYLYLLATPLAAAIICALLILLLRPLLVKYALARPNARSSHKIPTPQGGGVAVIAATIAAVMLSGQFAGIRFDAGLLSVFAATVFLASAGAVDDLRPIPVVPRLLLQALAIALVLASLPKGFQLFGFMPFWLERVLLLIGGLWFVNLVNFMDGLDWMTVAEIVPVAGALSLFGLTGHLHGNTTITMLALLGAIVGFAPFNRPVAKLFLGDVGSLPIGLLTGWCLLQLAGNGHLVAALLLPLYYLGDATITLLRRIGNGEEIWVAHRTHFYQRATDNGFTVMRVVAEVFALNIALAILAAITIYTRSPNANAIALALGCIMVALVLIRFSRPRDAKA
jgi:UDP-N-acetylmuramyl pentapeptide phosphotransferase/UDP-N-acetylglucosamine-1-phosphate transferase